MWFGTATSQSTVSNNQVQSADVFSDLVVDVASNTDGTTAVSTATGNSVVGSTVSGGLHVESSQTMSRNAIASTNVTIDQTPGATYRSTAAATGNSGDSVITSSYTMTGNLSQTTTGPTIDAESLTSAANAYVADATQTVQAVANGQQFGATDSNIVANLNQSNRSTVEANGAGSFKSISQQGVFSSTAAGNDLTSTANGASTQNLTVNQTNTGALTQAGMYNVFGSAEVTSTSAVATGNDIDASNTQGGLYVTGTQNNQSFVNAQADQTVDGFGASTVEAEGVGNTVVAANIGPDTGLNNVQSNGPGGVTANAVFTGGSGFDAAASASAIGNSATGYSCSSCGGVLNVWNSQSNAGGVSATTEVGVSGAARTTAGVATAAGNTATFYVSAPR